MKSLREMVFGYTEIPEGKTLVDPHAHFHRNLDPNDLVEAMFDRGVGVQAVCDYVLEKGDSSHVFQYQELVDRLRSCDGLSVKSSDRYSTKVQRGDQRLMLFQGREIESFVEGSAGGFLHDRHCMHIVVYGPEQGFDDAEEILKSNLDSHISAVIAHPFTIPARVISFVYANREEREVVVKLARKYQARLEGLNSANALWMAPTNRLVREAAEPKKDRPRIGIVGSTDAHARPDLELTRQQLGIAGTLIQNGYTNSLWETQGEDFLRGLNKAFTSGEIYGRVQDPILFFKVMVMPRLKNLF